jgi:V/A-type H+-transporting ATPase subunit E
LALADILDAIRSEADDEIKRIRMEADEEAAALLSRAREQAREEEARLARSRDEAATRQADRIVNRARLESDRAVRAEVEELYLQARRRVAEKLQTLREAPRYEEVLARLFEESRAALPEATAVRVNPLDAELMRRLLTAEPPLRIVPDPATTGGVVLIGDQGRVVRNDFASRLARAENFLRLIFADEVTRKVRS